MGNAYSKPIVEEDTFLIYKISSELTELKYVGSTKKKIGERLKQHIKNYKKNLKGKYQYVTSFEIIKEGNFKIELLEECEEEHRYIRERYWIENTENVVNKVIPGRTDAEYYQDNKEKINKRCSNYRENNKDKICEKIDCPCGGRYTHQNKSHHLKSDIHKNFVNKNNNIVINDNNQEIKEH